MDIVYVEGKLVTFVFNVVEVKGILLIYVKLTFCNALDEFVLTFYTPPD